MNIRTIAESIASIIYDYRIGETPSPLYLHVERWANQFDPSIRTQLLLEMNHVLQTTYISRDAIKNYFRDRVLNEAFTGSDPLRFWLSINFLNIQKNGQSQKELLEIFDEVFFEKFSFSLKGNRQGSTNYIYVDDVIFSGLRVGNDLEQWIINYAPPIANIYVVVLAAHTSGGWLLSNRLTQAVKTSGKMINITYLRGADIENRKSYRQNSEVLWPAAIPIDPLVQTYMAIPQKYPFEPRPAGGSLGPFSSENGRQLLEREFFLQGLKIRALCASPKDIMRPLGFSPFGIGFGSMIVTYRNCPNNCPLALWWGDPTADPSHPFSRWYPLFPRKTYETGFTFDEYDF